MVRKTAAAKLVSRLDGLKNESRDQNHQMSKTLTEMPEVGWSAENRLSYSDRQA